MSFFKETILKTTENQIEYEVFPESKTHLIKNDNNENLDELLDSKVDKQDGKVLSSNDFTDEQKNKLKSLNNYNHPDKHPASIITQDSNNRFVTDAQITAWNNITNEISSVVEDSFVTVNDSVEGAITDIEIFGKTVQDPNNLADIQSVGTKRDDGLYEMGILSTGKNLISNNFLPKEIISNTGGLTVNDSETWQSSDLIKIKANINYTFSKNEGTGDGYTYVYRYDLNGVFKGTSERLDLGISKFIITSAYDCLIRIGTRLVNTQKFQLEEGTVATPYEPYQFSKSSILMPVQLEKVGDVTDRLYYDESEKAWCIDDINKNVNINRYSNIVVDDSLSDIYRVSIDTNVNIGHGIRNIISSVVPYRKNMSWGIIEEGSYTDTSDKYNNRVWFHINKSKVIGTVEDYIKSKMPISLIYQATTPTKIVLPLDQQITLNSFFGTTHISTEDTIIEPTIKAKVSKSIGASVQSLTEKTDKLEDRVENIEELRGSVKLEGYTEKGYVVSKDSKKGRIDNFKLEGRTLVNLWGNNPSDFVMTGQATFNSQLQRVEVKTTSNRFSNAFVKNLDKIKPGTKYTLIVNIFKNELDPSNNIFINNPHEATSGAFNDSIKISGGITGVFTYTIVSRPSFDSLTDKETGLRTYIDALKGVADRNVQFQMILLEGDHTQNPPSYFEGLKSVGEDTKRIEVLSRKEDGNLFDGVYTNGAVSTSNGTILPNVSFKSTSFMVIDSKSTYYLNDRFDNHCGLAFYDMAKRFISGTSVPYQSGKLTNIPSNAKFARFTVGLEYIKDFYIVKDTTPKPQEPHQSHKKQILYYNDVNELVPVPVLREWDKVENGKYTVGSGQVVLNGSEDFALFKPNVFYIQLENAYTVSSKLVCDKYIEISRFWDDVIVTNGAKIHSSGKLYIKDMDCSTVDSFKAKLQANNVIVVYQLATPKVYECLDTELESYEGETLVSIESSPIVPKSMSFEINSHIGGIVTKVKEDVKELKDWKEEMSEQVTHYKESENGCVVIEDTKEGIVKDLEIQGKTLVNALIGASPLNNNERFGFKFIENPIFRGNTFTFFNNTGRKIVVDIYVQDKYKRAFVMYPNDTRRVETLAADEHVYYMYGMIADGWTADMVSILKSSCIALLGEHIKETPDYFEGLKSVGDGKEALEVFSRKEDGNLLKATTSTRTTNGVTLSYNENSGMYTITGTCTADNTNITIPSNIQSTPLEGRYSATVSLIQGKPNGLSVRFYNGDFSRGVAFNLQDKLTAYGEYIKGDSVTFSFRMNKGNKFNGEQFKVCFNKTQTPKELDYLEHRKQLMYYDETGVIQKIPSLREHDYIKDNRYTVGSGQITFTGDSQEVWKKNNEDSGELYVRFFIQIEGVDPNTPYDIACNLLRAGSIVATEGEGIFIAQSKNIHIKLFKSRLKTLDVTGLKEWLKENNLTIVYRVETPITYECVDLSLNAYEGETSVIVDGGIISPKLSCKAQSNLLEVLDNLKLRIQDLEKGVGYVSSDGVTGWTRLSNGLLIQWGMIGTDPNTDARKNFPIKFNKCFIVNATIQGGDSASSLGVSAMQTNEYVTLRHRHSLARDLKFLAIGI